MSQEPEFGHSGFYVLEGKIKFMENMKNYFEELSEKGITEVDLTAKEIQGLLISGKISTEQARQCFIQKVGQEKFWEIFNETLETYI